MRRWRIALGVAGTLLGLFGVFRIITQVPLGSTLLLACWLLAAVIIHDGVLVPLVLAVGAVVSRIPPRARRSVQAALLVGGIVTSIALPLIARRDTQPQAKALLLGDYGGHLALLLSLIAVVSLTCYAVRVALQWKP